jgi:hypothetical protein
MFPIGSAVGSISYKYVTEIFKECILLYISTIYELYFPVKHNNIPINSLTFHCTLLSLLVVQCHYMFRLMEPSSGDTLTDLIIELCILYGSIYCIYHCVTITWRNIVCFSHFCLITVICTDCISYCFKNVLNMYLNLLKVLKHYKL